MVMRRFVADAEIIELDSNGRILLNKRKKEHAGIKQEVRFLAVDDRIEIWDKAVCDEMLRGCNNDEENLGQSIASLMGF
jgi:MraZ protein